jgi:uncharacterized membrane protein
MEPIVSPWIVYLVGNCDSISIITYIPFICCCLILFVLLVNYVISSDSGSRESEEKAHLLLKKKYKLLCILGSVFFVLALLVPGKKTVIGMLVAQEVTIDRVAAGKELVEEVRQQIKKDTLDIIQSIKEERFVVVDKTEKSKE